MDNLLKESDSFNLNDQSNGAKPNHAGNDFDQCGGSKPNLLGCPIAWEQHPPDKNKKPQEQHPPDMPSLAGCDPDKNKQPPEKVCNECDDVAGAVSNTKSKSNKQPQSNKQAIWDTPIPGEYQFSSSMQQPKPPTNKQPKSNTKTQQNHGGYNDSHKPKDNATPKAGPQPGSFPKGLTIVGGGGVVQFVPCEDPMEAKFWLETQHEIVEIQLEALAQATVDAHDSGDPVLIERIKANRNKWLDENEKWGRHQLLNSFVEMVKDYRLKKQEAEWNRWTDQVAQELRECPTGSKK